MLLGSVKTAVKEFSLLFVSFGAMVFNRKKESLEKAAKIR